MARLREIIAIALCATCIVAASAIANPEPKQDLVRLGEILFSEAALSRDGRVSCASCHSSSNFYVDGYERALARTRELIRNTPTILNVNFYTSYFWDGRALSLEEQIREPLFAKHELGSDSQRMVEALARLLPLAARKRPDEAESFVVQSIAAYLRQNATTETKFSRFRAGTERLSDREEEGFSLFKKYGCSSCHSEPHFTDNKFHDNGLFKRKIVLETTVDRNGHTIFALGHDYGRGNIASGPEQLFRFRTPSLMNVMRTAPYMHDGSFRDIDEVLLFYARRMGSPPDVGMYDAKEREALKSFFETLTDLRHGR